MTQTKKLGFGVVASALFAVMAFATLVSTASADITALTATNTTTGGISTVTAATADGPVVFEILGTSTTTGATFLSTSATSNGTILECTDADALCDVDGDANEVAVRIFVPSGSAAGTVAVRATDDDDTDTVNITVTSASGAATGVTLTGPTSIANGGSADVTVYNTSASGARVAVTDVNLTVTRGTLAQDNGVAANDCVAIADDDDGATGNDGTCLADTVTSTTAPTKVGVYENGAIGETVVVNAFFNVNGVPTVAQHTMTIAGVAASATITAPATIAAGATGEVKVNILDAGGNAAPPTTVTVVTSEGAVACPSTTSASGTVTCTFVAPGSAQTVVITAIVDVPNSSTDIVVTANVAVTGSATPGGTPGTGDGTFASAPNFGTGNVGSAVFNGGTIADLADAVTDAGGTAVWVQGTDGNWYRYNTLATGATAFVNNAFNAQFSAGFTGATAVFVVK